jgi:sec-independent protein translocase protein TatA
MIPNIGPLEIAIVLVIALIVFGPKKLPELGRSIGSGINEFRHGLSNMGDSDRDREDEDPDPDEITARSDEGSPPVAEDPEVTEIKPGQGVAEPVDGEVVGRRED